MRWTASRKCECPHLIRHGFAVPPPLEGEALGLRTSKASPMMRINSRNRKKDDKRRKKRDSKV